MILDPQKFDYVEMPVAPPRPQLHKKIIPLTTTVVEEVKQLENAFLGINPLTDVVVLARHVDEKTFEPWVSFYIPKKGLAYSAPLRVYSQAGDEKNV